MKHVEKCFPVVGLIPKQGFDRKFDLTNKIGRVNVMGETDDAMLPFDPVSYSRAPLSAREMTAPFMQHHHVISNTQASTERALWQRPTGKAIHDMILTSMSGCLLYTSPSPRDRG